MINLSDDIYAERNDWWQISESECGAASAWHSNNFVAPGADQDLSSRSEEQPSERKLPVPVVRAKGLLTKSFSYYHRLAENIAAESLVLSEHPVCKQSPEIAGDVEAFYRSVYDILEGVGGCVEIYHKHGRREKDPEEVGLLILGKKALTNAVGHMKEEYHINNIPALEEAWVEVEDRIQNLMRLRKKHQVEDVVEDVAFEVDEPELGN